MSAGKKARNAYRKAMLEYHSLPFRYILTLFNKHDPVGIANEVHVDEYAHEVGMVLNALPHMNTPEEVPRVLSEIIREMFGIHFPNDRLALFASDIWSVWEIWRNPEIDRGATDSSTFMRAFQSELALAKDRLMAVEAANF